MAHTFDDVESIWRDAWIAKDAAAATFQEQLSTQWQAVRRLNAAGSLSSVSKNSASQAAAFGGTSTLTTVDLERAALEAMRLYERLAAGLGTSIEADIYAEGLVQLRNSPTEAFGDIALLRYQ